jgi:hypothetical protein
MDKRVDTTKKTKTAKKGTELKEIKKGEALKVESKKAKKPTSTKSLYILTHREVDQHSKTVAYHLANRKGTQYRVEKELMIEMVRAGTVKDVTLREVAGHIQVIGVGLSVGLYPKVLNLSEMPVRALNFKGEQEKLKHKNKELDYSNIFKGDGIIMDLEIVANKSTALKRKKVTNVVECVL